MSLASIIAARRTRIWAPGLLLAVGLSALVGVWLLQQRSDAVRHQQRELALLSLALADETDRGLQGADEGLQTMRKELRQGQLPLQGDAAVAALRTRADLMPLVSSLWLVRRPWQMTSASDPIPLPRIGSFQPSLGSLPEGKLAVSKTVAPGPNGASLIVLAVDFTAEQGAATGWILAAIPADDLLGAFSVASPAPDARMALFRADGTRLAGTASPMLLHALRGAIGRSHAVALPGVQAFADGTRRLVALNRLQHYDLDIVLTRDLQAVLQPWRETTRLTLAGLVVVWSVIALAAGLVARANRRGEAAQAALQAQRNRTGRLESLGTLAGGVAHDFNNVLATIVGFGEMAQDAAAPGSSQARHLDKVLQAALRGKALVERILRFSKGGARVSVVFELAPVVTEVLDMLAASLRPGVVIERDRALAKGRVRGDPTQAFEAVMNLCANAMQAMPDGGMLRIRLARITAAAPRVLSHSELKAGRYLMLTVSDEGMGITPEAMDRLFEPFFTTRDASAGTGLGLAVVHGVVAEFGGAIDVASQLGAGTEFMLYLPECDRPAQPLPRVGEPAPRGAGQRVMVVDDDPALMAWAVELLERWGYAPVGYTDPAAALQALTEQTVQFAAVISDEVMHAMTGTQLTAQLRRFAPNLPVLLVSGYGGAALASRAHAAGVTRVLTKPLQSAELVFALGEVLSGEAPDRAT
jgi:signal transduction histidine kinase/ActR/RegA family two-component response regulator